MFGIGLLQKYYFDFEKIFCWGNSKWQKIKQNNRGFKKGLSSNFSWLRNANQEEFTDMYKEPCFCQNNGLKIGLSVQAWVKDTVHGAETHGLSSKEKVPGIVVKKGHGNRLLEHERTHHYWFPQKRCNCKWSILLLTPNAKSTTFIEWPLYIYIYICIYTHSKVKNSVVMVTWGIT